MHFKNPTGFQHVQVENGENLTITLQDFEPGNRDFELKVQLLGKEAQCTITGRAQTTGQDRKSWKVAQIFEGQDQVGSIDLRGTAEDESFLAFDGSGTLAQTSIDADANITEKIILFDQAKGRSLPVLRVETDKVKSAGHGASIAPVDPEKCLYLQSRGISKKEAENMIREGFLVF